MPRKLVLLLAVASLAIPANAVASTKSATTFASGNGAIASATATCKSGQRATGGGWIITPARISPSLLISHVYESQKVGQKSWRVSAQIQGASDLVSLTGYVYCSEDAPKTTTKLATTTAVPEGFLSPQASCGSKRAQAGGFNFTPPVVGGGFRTSVFGSLRSSKSTWRTIVAITTGIPSATATTYAYCASSPKPKSSSASTSGGGNDTVRAVQSPSCKNGTQIVAGGFDQTPFDVNDRFHVWESRKSGKSWRITGTHGGGAPVKTLTSYGYCA